MTKKSALQRLLNEPVGKQTHQFLLVSEHFELIDQLIETGQSYKRICDCLQEDGYRIHQQTLKRHYLQLKENPGQRVQGRPAQKRVAVQRQSVAVKPGNDESMTMTEGSHTSENGIPEQPPKTQVDEQGNEQQHGQPIQESEQPQKVKTMADYFSKDFDPTQVKPPPPLVQAEVVDS